MSYKYWKDIVSRLRGASLDYVLSIEHEDALASTDLKGLVRQHLPEEVIWINPCLRHGGSKRASHGSWNH